MINNSALLLAIAKAPVTEYEVYTYSDNLKPGEEMKISHSVRVQDSTNITTFTALTVEELQAGIASNEAEEQAIFQKMRDAFMEWEQVAAITQMLQMAVEYNQVKAVEHTGNAWGPDKYANGEEMSNAVYAMWVRLREDTRYSRDTREHEPYAWYVDWHIHINAPDKANGYRYRTKIAGQDRKRFTDKAAAEKYITGRKKAYAHLFTEIYPPIPAEHKSAFCVNGKLLPGYSVQGE